MVADAGQPTRRLGPGAIVRVSPTGPAGGRLGSVWLAIDRDEPRSEALDDNKLEETVVSAGLAERSARRAYLADGALAVVTLIWGSTFVVVKDALLGIGPFTFLALRFGVAFVVLVVLFHRQARRLGPDGLRAGVLIGVLLALGYAFQTVGLRWTSASRAGFITGLSVVIVPLLAFLVLKQRRERLVLLGVGLATLGLWLLSADSASSLGVGDLLVFGCALAFAGHIVAIGAFAAKHEPLGLAVVQVGVVAVIASGAAVFFEAPVRLPPNSAVTAALYTGVLATAAAYAIQNSAQRFASPTHTALIFTLEPAFAAAIAWVVAGETLGLAGLAGGVLILSGMVIAEVRR
jgi:drug/metabolite transporter (DMT)-like permease